MGGPTSKESERRGHTAARGVTLLVVAAVMLFDVWTVRSGRVDWDFGAPQTDYYNQLINGFLDGHLSMKADVPAELLQAENPYDPAKRPSGIAKHDASLYHGKYYLYFGAVPAVTLMLPFKLITGIDMPLRLTVIIFVCGGFGVSVVLWLRLRRTYFPKGSSWLDPAGTLALGLAGMGPVLLRRANVWETPISSGYFFAMLGLLGVFRALHSERRAAAWMAMASLSFGLAVGSRPTYFFATSALLIPLLWWWQQGRRDTSAQWWTGATWGWRAVAGVAPLAAIGVALAWYNYARFGNIFEFGVSYELSGVYEGKVKHFSASYVPLNFHRYFWAPAKWTSSFPFVDPEPVKSAPDGYYVGDDLFGLWRNVPLTWLAVVAFAALWRRRRTGFERLAVWAGAAVAVFCGVAGFIVFFYSAMGRYLVDFSPVLVLLGCIGMAVCEESAAAATRRWVRWLVRLGYGGVFAFSVSFAFFYSLEFNGEFRARNPRVFRTMARWFNHVPELIGEWRGTPFGLVEMEVRVLPATMGGERNLVATGAAPRLDRVFMRTVDSTHVQIGFEHGAREPSLSRPLPAEPSIPHKVRVEMGSLVPPEDYPGSAWWDRIPGIKPNRRLQVEWDGEPVLADRQSFFPSEFDTMILDGRRLASPSRQALDRNQSVDVCDWRLRLRFPLEPGEIEPLVRLEERAIVDIIAVERTAPGMIRFRCDRAGRDSIISEPMPVDGRAVHEVSIEVAGPGPARRLTVKIGRQIIWAPRVAMNDPHTSAVRYGAAAASASFASRIFGAEQFFDEVDPLYTHYGPIRLRVEFPKTNGPQREPLVVTGVEGHGDLLSVEYLDAQHVLLLYDHWGAGPIYSDPVAIDYTQAHEIEVSFGALVAGADAIPLEATFRRIRVILDGRTVLNRPASFNFAESDEVYFGFNPIGGTSCGVRFTGEILAVERRKVRDAGAPVPTP